MNAECCWECTHAKSVLHSTCCQHACPVWQNPASQAPTRVRGAVLAPARGEWAQPIPEINVGEQVGCGRQAQGKRQGRQQGASQGGCQQHHRERGRPVNSKAQAPPAGGSSSSAQIS